MLSDKGGEGKKRERDKQDWATVSIHRPGSRSSHTGRRCRCPGGCELPTAGRLHPGPVPPPWTRSAGGPGRTTEGSGTPPSRSGGRTRRRTACGLSTATGQLGPPAREEDIPSGPVSRALLFQRNCWLTNDLISRIFQPTLGSALPSLHPLCLLLTRWPRHTAVARLPLPRCQLYERLGHSSSLLRERRPQDFAPPRPAVAGTLLANCAF